ncbi:MAG: FG-GAP-like repeat-containing protein [Bacteroidales bacterium]|nr:FG-GAP-like repeat-containing protein [Bacteroidales bacterium]
MKTIIIFLFLIPFLTFSQNKSLYYIESSTGLNYPDWDGGNSELEFADMNGDGFVDIVSVGDHGNPYINTAQHGIMVYFNDGTGSWNVQMTGNFGYGGIAIGDVNNDGLWDAGYGIHHNYSSTDLGDQILEVALGDGTGTNWTAWDDGLATNGEDWGMFGTDFADIDNDGDLDVGSVSFGSGAGVHVYANQMDGSWIQTFGFLGGNAADRFVFGDINNDGNSDFIVAHQYGAVYFGDGTGNFINADGNLPGSGYYFGPSLGDIDNDGDKDIAFVLNDIEVWGWNQDDEVWIDTSGNLTGTSQFSETQLYDMNADGYMDLSAYGNGVFKLWLGDGTGNWTEETQFNTTEITSCQAFRVGGDVDHNGYPDIVLVAEAGSWPSWQNYLRCYKEASEADSLWIKGLFPKGNEVFFQNSIQFIDWVSEVPEGVPTYVRLLFSATGPEGTWDVIGDYLSNSGRHQWTVPYVYSDNCFIRLIVWSGDSLIAAANAGPFTITGDPVVQAEFSADPTYGAAPLEVHFTDLSTGIITLWEWDFNNDGTIDSQEQNPVWIYEEPGDYSVWLYVSNSVFSDTVVKFDYIFVGPAPVAGFNGDPTIGQVPLEVQFTNLSAGYVTYWEWDFQNDGIIDSYEENPDFTYMEPDTFSVKLKVSNGLSFDSLVKEDYIVANLNSMLNEKLFPEIQVYPNPFHDQTFIKITRNEKSDYLLKIRDLYGKILFSLTNQRSQQTNQLSILWDGTDQSGNKLSPGVYLLIFQSEDLSFKQKIILK